MAVFTVTWLVINLVLPLLALGTAGNAAAAALQPLAVLVSDVAPPGTLPRPWAWGGPGRTAGAGLPGGGVGGTPSHTPTLVVFEG